MLSTLRKTTIELSPNDVFSLCACRNCEKNFGANRQPRLLACSCVVCSQCARELVQSTTSHTFSAITGAAHVRRKWKITCNGIFQTCTGEETIVTGGQVESIKVAASVVETVRILREAARLAGDDATANPLAGADSQFVSLAVKNLAQDVTRHTVNINLTVGELKALIRAEANGGGLGNSYLPHLLVLSLPATEVRPATLLDDDARTIASYGISDNCTINALVREGYRGGELIPGPSGCFTPARVDTSNTNTTRRVTGVTLTQHGHFLLACDEIGTQHPGDVLDPCVWKLDFQGRVLGKLRGSFDGVSMERPRFVCMSPCGFFAYVTDNCRVLVFNIVTDVYTDTLRALEFRDLTGVAASPCGQFLYVASSSDHCVYVVRLQNDKSIVRVIGGIGSGAGQFFHPAGLCLSGDGMKLFVADSLNRRVQILQVSANPEAGLETPVATLLIIGQIVDPNVPGIFRSVSDVKLSSDGDLVYVVDDHSAQVNVFCAQTGAHVHSIGGRGLELGQFICPIGISLGQRAGQPVLVVGDYHNGRIQSFTVPACAGVSRAAGDDACAPIEIDLME